MKNEQKARVRGGFHKTGKKLTNDGMPLIMRDKIRHDDGTHSEPNM